jgi:hypothetical protein
MPRPRKQLRLQLKSVGKRADGSISKIWYIKGPGVSVSTGCRQECAVEAEAALAQFILKNASAARSTTRLLAPDEVSVSEVIALYASERAPDLADPVGAGVRLQHVLDHFGDKMLSDVTRAACDGYVAQRTAQAIRSFKDPTTARRVSPQAARRELEDLSAAIGWWDSQHRLTRPIKVHYPPKPESPRDALTRKQAAALLLAALGWRRHEGRWSRARPAERARRGHLRRFLLLGLLTGTRPGVLPQLRWSESDDHPWVDLEHGWIRRRGRLQRDRPTKRQPLCRIPSRLLAHLRRWHAMDEAENLMRAKAGLPLIETVLHYQGRAIGGRIRKAYRAALMDAGLPTHITPHWHRHSCASWLMASGVRAAAAAEYLGMTEEVLRKHYDHFRPDFQDEIDEAIKRFGKPRGRD